jgi:antitoxin (DNA-binding transcriptional repressor) of toxin-antitoxin stability system
MVIPHDFDLRECESTWAALGCKTEGASAKDGRMTVSATITIEEAQARLQELIDHLAPGEAVIITRNKQPVARLVGEQPHHAPRPAPGLGKGSILYMAPDFDEPLEEFKEYTE